MNTLTQTRRSATEDDDLHTHIVAFDLTTDNEEAQLNYIEEQLLSIAHNPTL